MYRKFVEFVKQNELFGQNEQLVVGVSGGADSVCLLSLLCKYKEEYGLNLTVVHINHGIRTEAGADAEFVRALCEKSGLPFVLKEYPVEELSKEWGMSTEEAGRKVRYEAFSEVLNGTGKDGKIAVAHNKNDVAETVLFHLFRGSSTRGLSGIHAKNGNVVRPILCFSREEIEKYLEENGLSFCIDKTNLTDDYTRNKIRNHILPYAEKEIVKGSVSHIYDAAGFLKEQEEYLDLLADKEFAAVAELDEKKGTCIFDKAALKDRHIFMQKKLLYKAMEMLSGSRKDLTSKHVESVLSLFKKDGMKFVMLPYNLQAKSEYNKVIIEKREGIFAPEQCEQELESAEAFTFRIFSDKMPDTIPEKTYTKWFDYDKIDGSLVIRTRKEGDYLTVRGGHTKSLNRYFIDEKVPRDERDKVLLLADGSHILWVIGGRISEYYKITKDTKQIIEIQYDGGLCNGETSY